MVCLWVLTSSWCVRQMRFWVAVPLRLACTVLTAVSLPTVRVRALRAMAPRRLLHHEACCAPCP